MAVIMRGVGFFVVFCVLQFSWQTREDSGLHHALMDHGIVAPTARCARLLTPTLGIYASGNRLRGPSGGINIVNGCDGMETLFLLVAAFCVARLSMRARLTGTLTGVPIVYLVDMVRIIMLFHGYQRGIQTFDTLHGSVTTP